MDTLDTQNVGLSHRTFALVINQAAFSCAVQTSSVRLRMLSTSVSSGSGSGSDEYMQSMSFPSHEFP